MAAWVIIDIPDFDPVTIDIECSDGPKTTMNRSLLPRFKIFQEMLQTLPSNPSCLKIDDAKTDWIKKIIEWAEHYPANPMSTTSNVNFTDWDKAFFSSFDGAEAAIDTALLAEEMELEGFGEYVDSFINQEFKRLSLPEQDKFWNDHDVNDTELFRHMAKLVLKK